MHTNLKSNDGKFEGKTNCVAHTMYAVVAIATRIKLTQIMKERK